MTSPTDLIFLAPPVLPDPSRDESLTAYEAYLQGATNVAIRR